MVDYNKVAILYDLLGRMVFGNKLEMANRAFLSKVPAGSKVLIVGGGTGSIIEYINELGYHISIDYVELSAKMIAYARKRKCENLSIKFHNLPVENFTGGQYDIIIANFFFDQFSVSKSEGILKGLMPSLRQNGNLIVSDFNSSDRIGDKLLMSLMIAFFRLAANIEVSKLPDYDKALKHSGFTRLDTLRIGSNITASLYSINFPEGHQQSDTTQNRLANSDFLHKTLELLP